MKPSNQTDAINNFSEVLSPFQIRLFANICSILGKANEPFKAELLYGNAMKHPEMPFEAGLNLITFENSFWIYTDGADVSGGLQIRFECDDFETLDELAENFLNEVIKFY